MSDSVETAQAAFTEDLRRIVTLFGDAPGGIILSSGRDHVIEMMNAAYAAWIGHRRVVGLPAREAFPNLAPLGFLDLMDEVYRSGRSATLRGTRTVVSDPEGRQEREAFVDFVLQPIRDRDGRVMGLFCQGHDVTEQKVATDALKESREQLRAALEATEAIFDNSHDLICVVDINKTFVQVNRAAERILGWKPEEMMGRPYSEFIHPDDIETSESITGRIAQGVLTNTFTTRYRIRDGGYAPIMWSAVWSDAHQSLFGIGRDMREHIASEEKLRQAQKMEAIGRMSGGIAHDFNNLLTAVIGATETLADALQDHPHLAAPAQEALEAAERGAELVSQLMAVSRTQPLAPQPIDCNRFLRGLAPMLRRTLGGQIDVDFTPSRGAAWCQADLTQLTSALLNLCINARDAMPNGGRLRLSVELQAARGEAPAYVVMSVLDTGEGMDAKTRAQALEPFFTTKPAGKGSGLGLSMVYGFVIQSGGRMDIESERGVGTRVSIALPATPAAAGDVAAAPDAPVIAHAPQILVVEDDELVRGQVERHLVALGCRVRSCAGGREALDVLASGGQVDLLMTDINMPGGMNGRQLADHARLLFPQLHILFTSGHTDDPILQKTRYDARTGFIAKPYRRADLARALTRVLPSAT